MKPVHDAKTLKEVVDILGSDFSEMEFQDIDVSVARRLYGKNVYPLTPSLIQRLNLIGAKGFYVLQGQQWYSARTVAEKRNAISKIKLLEYPDELRSTPNRDDDDIAIQEIGGPFSYHTEIYIASMCTGAEKVYGTGSGCDPIYIFLALERSEKKSKSKRKSKSSSKSKKSKSRKECEEKCKSKCRSKSRK
jgi:hypothetical protein